MKTLKRAIIQNRLRLANAMDMDFNGRSRDESYLAEVVCSLEAINHSIKRIKKWMKPSRRRPGYLFLPSRAKVYYQPLGIVGIIVPWNYPFYLMATPLVGALAAGNRVCVKMSKHTPNTAQTVKALLGEIFNEDLVAVFSGQEISGSEFSAQPWNHLLFTGSTVSGKDVMRSAAENLTPVTLELGGKSPAIISQEVPIMTAARRIAWGKLLNAGQTCVAPDHVLCPENRIDGFVESFREAVGRMYPTLKDNKDYTSIENDYQYERLQAFLSDAAAKGAGIIEINPAKECFAGTRKMPVYIILNVDAEMEVMKQEIFGPILPVVAYKTLEDAVSFVNCRPRPLALYYFDYNRKNIEYIIHNTHSGGILINDTIAHAAQHDLPFGGIGPSGMGVYHGWEGFLTFSKAKGVLIKPKFNSAEWIYPPYGRALHKLLYRFLFREGEGT